MVPFWGFPYSRNYNRYIPYNRYRINNVNNSNNIIKDNINEKKDIKNNTVDYTENNSKEKKDCFEIFGLKLYSDDILILCLIFFLYNEGVKDTELFIALILLLLS